MPRERSERHGTPWGFGSKGGLLVEPSRRRERGRVWLGRRPGHRLEPGPTTERQRANSVSRVTKPLKVPLCVPEVKSVLRFAPEARGSRRVSAGCAPDRHTRPPIPPPAHTV